MVGFYLKYYCWKSLCCNIVWSCTQSWVRSPKKILFSVRVLRKSSCFCIIFWRCVLKLSFSLLLAVAVFVLFYLLVSNFYVEVELKLEKYMNIILLQVWSCMHMAEHAKFHNKSERGRAIGICKLIASSFIEKHFRWNLEKGRQVGTASEKSELTFWYMFASLLYDYFLSFTITTSARTTKYTRSCV